MDFTARMVALLGRLRRERNGVVTDSMCYYGAPYGLNYGVSLPTVRAIARAETPDHAFARYLFLQDVRELRLAALHIAQPACVTPVEFASWADGIVNSEVAEEAAFALLSRTACFPQWFDSWIVAPNYLLQYAVLQAAARADHRTMAWAQCAVDAVRGCAADPMAARLVAQGAVALLMALAAQNEQNRQAVSHVAGSLGKTPSEEYLHEELAWRLEA
ncbi:MAG: DNA alkylation repair enzyme [Alistipes sp.]